MASPKTGEEPERTPLRVLSTARVRQVIQKNSHVPAAGLHVEETKTVKDGPGFHPWRDTTTLFTKLHRGTDKSGEVVGAGILKLGTPELIAMSRTMRVRGATTGEDRAEGLAMFGSFFFGQLWESYIKHARI